MWWLTVAVIVTSLENPDPHSALTVRIPYPTQFTCEHAMNTDMEFESNKQRFIALAQLSERTTVRKVTAECGGFTKGEPLI